MAQKEFVCRWGIARFQIKKFLTGFDPAGIISAMRCRWGGDLLQVTFLQLSLGTLKCQEGWSGFPNPGNWFKLHIWCGADPTNCISDGTGPSLMVLCLLWVGEVRGFSVRGEEVVSQQLEGLWDGCLGKKWHQSIFNIHVIYDNHEMSVWGRNGINGV